MVVCHVSMHVHSPEAPCTEGLGVPECVAQKPRESTHQAADWGDSGLPLLRANGFSEIYIYTVNVLYKLY